MRNILCPILLSAMLAACGGGESSSGAGSTADVQTSSDPGGVSEPSREASVPLTAGTYQGTETLTFTVPGEFTRTETGPINITIDSAGNVTVTDEDGARYIGSLSGTQFTAQGTSRFTEDGFSCAGPGTYEGSLSGGQVSGRTFGNVTCTGDGGSFVVTGDGTFSAARA